MDLFRTMKQVASENISEAIIYFSTGKDSVVMLDLCSKYFDLNKCKIIFQYINRLKYKDDYINKISDRYKTEIIQLPHPDLARIYKSGTFGCKKQELNVSNYGDYDNSLRDNYKIKYMAYGYKQTDGMSRRGLILKSVNGVDKKNSKIYPVAYYSNAMIFEYVKRNRLILPPEYNYGYRDINALFVKEHIIWLRKYFYEDYLSVKEQFPLIESSLLRE